MASRAVMYWRRVVAKENIIRVNGAVCTRSFVSSTTPKMATAASSGSGGFKKPKMVEMYPLFGMLVMALAVAVHTAYQNIVHAPGIKLSKKKRESLPEIDYPDDTVLSSGKVIDRSFLRKIGQIQHDNNPIMPNNARPNPYTVSRDVETLKSIGVGPRKN